MNGDGPAPIWHEHCLLCGSGDLAMLGKYQRTHLVRCRQCSMVFAARRATEPELEAHYIDYGHAWHDSPITRRRYGELLDSFELHRSTNRILDFGCGAGFFLEQARARGWEAYGIEYGARALTLARAKQLEVMAAPLDSDTFTGGSFDVVTAFEVFEHVRDPHAEAAAVARVLRPDGLLYCTTPNFDALSRRVLGPRWKVIDYPEHLCYFTSATLRGWLARHQLRAESIETTGISVSALRGLAPGTIDAEQASPEEQLREAIEHSSTLQLGKRAANSILSALRLGDTLKGRFRLNAHPLDGASEASPAPALATASAELLARAPSARAVPPQRGMAP